MQGDSFRSQAEDITKDGYIFLKCVLDHDTCDFNREPLGGCVETVKLKPQKWSVQCSRQSLGFGKSSVLSSTYEGRWAGFLPSHLRQLHEGARRCTVNFQFYVS